MFAFRLIDETSARDVMSWRYDPPYDVYNLDPDSEELLQVLLDRNTACYGLTDASGDLVGFCTFGADGQVPGGDYSREALDIGMGIRPDLTGRGKGSVYVNAVLEFAMLTFAPATVRVTVATFNHRARSVWEKAGFCEVQQFERIPDGMRFAVLTLRPPAG
jgi:ribosomal-protein-alanine N-acetyltransferase